MVLGLEKKAEKTMDRCGVAVAAGCRESQSSAWRIYRCTYCKEGHLDVDNESSQVGGIM